MGRKVDSFSYLSTLLLLLILISFSNVIYGRQHSSKHMRADKRATLKKTVVRIYEYSDSIITIEVQNADGITYSLRVPKSILKTPDVLKNYVLSLLRLFIIEEKNNKVNEQPYEIKYENHRNRFDYFIS